MRKENREKKNEKYFLAMVLNQHHEEERYPNKMK